jgi:hypothetical protein
MPWIMMLAVVAFAAAVMQRRRIREYIEGDPRLDDDMIRRIEQQGSLELEEPLDFDHIREEEERFLNETWDLPDEE